MVEGNTGDQPAQDTQTAGMELMAVKQPEAKKGFILFPKRWVVKRNFAWMSCFRRLVCASERTLEVLCGLHFIAFCGQNLALRHSPPAVSHNDRIHRWNTIAGPVRSHHLQPICSFLNPLHACEPGQDVDPLPLERRLHRL